MKPTCPGRGCVGVYGFVLLFKAPFFFWKGSNWSPWAEICNIFDTGTERNETERDLENIWFDSFRFVPFLASYVYVAFRSVLFQSVRFRSIPFLYNTKCVLLGCVRFYIILFRSVSVPFRFKSHLFVQFLFVEYQMCSFCFFSFSGTYIFVSFRFLQISFIFFFLFRFLLFLFVPFRPKIKKCCPSPALYVTLSTILFVISKGSDSCTS